MYTPNRRTVLASGAAAMGLMRAGFASASSVQARTGSVSIAGKHFLIDGKVTYAGRRYRDMPIEGLLFVSRMANAIVDDHNPGTRGVWARGDDQWDADKNTDAFIANLGAYRAKGLTCVAINMQGGSPQGYSWN